MLKTRGKTLKQTKKRQNINMLNVVQLLTNKDYFYTLGQEWQPDTGERHQETKTGSKIRTGYFKIKQEIHWSWQFHIVNSTLNLKSKKIKKGRLQNYPYFAWGQWIGWWAVWGVGGVSRHQQEVEWNHCGGIPQDGILHFGFGFRGWKRW